MRRLIFTMLALGVFLLPLIVVAQSPVTTEEPPIDTGSETVPAEAAPIVVPQAAPLPTAIGATAVPVSPLDPEALPILVNARTDLELLANQALGNPRPEGWSGSLDINNVQLPILIRLDLELLAGTIMGADSRPEGWFGPVPSSAYAIARDIRHDLELLADRLNPSNVRPNGWAGSDPLLRCDRGIQNLVELLEKNGAFQLNTDVNAPDFCQAAELQASKYVEVNLLSNPAAASVGGSISVSTVPGSVRVNSQFAVAFLTRYGNQQVGTVPLGEVIKPIARSYTQFSKMILVQGDNFEVFMDYRDTTLTDAQFIALDNIDAISVNPACNAGWCKAPSG